MWWSSCRFKEAILPLILFINCEKILPTQGKVPPNSLKPVGFQRPPSSQASENQAKQYLQALETRYSAACNRQILTKWDYITNVTEATSKASTEANTAYLNFQAQIQKEILTRFPNWKDFKDEKTRREFKYLTIRGPGSMPSGDVAAMTKMQGQMESDYSTATVCEYKNPSKCNYRLDPEIENILHESQDPNELAHYWTAWYNKMSEIVPPKKFQRFLAFQAAMAKSNGFKDMSEMWMVSYDDETPNWTPNKFKEQMMEHWEEIKPMYNTLHAYVRMKLREQPQYKGVIDTCGFIPAHLTGNMWGQSWTQLDKPTKPYPNAPSPDGTDAMSKNNYTVLKMFQESEKFFTDLGLLPMTESFWTKSMLERPTDGREVDCHASAEDMCLGKGSRDFRIKQCTKVNLDHLIRVHHEMGHIEYFQQYTNESYIFREGANPGFREAIGDAIALAVATPKHLQCVLKLDLGLDASLCSKKPGTRASGEVTETDINYLYLTALKKLVFFPFAISMENWRWEAFEGKLSPQQYNRRWWELRMKNQGIKPPSDRSSPNFFDPAADFHIISNTEYLRYFTSHILQFQFYEAMCIAAGEFDPLNKNSKPLHQCDFSGSKKAGALLGNMMKLGFSKGWPVALETITGSRKMSISSLKNYFQPLLDHMEKELDMNRNVPGFADSCPDLAKYYLQFVYEKKISKLLEEYRYALWNYETDLTNTTARDLLEEMSIKANNVIKSEWENFFRYIDVDSVKDPAVKRQLKDLKVIGDAALPDDELKRYNKIRGEILGIYATGKICPYQKQNCDLDKEGLSLNPGIQNILIKSRDYDELSYVWKAWRDATGKKMRTLYNEDVDLGNEVAKLNGFKSLKEMWWMPYESDTFQADCETLWGQVKPVYEELHAYARYKLRQIYPQIGENDSIPAHVFGNMWAQSWDHLNDIMAPFPNASKFDVTEALQQRYTQDLKGVTGMFEVANEFFTSLGLFDMSEAYGPKALIIKPKDRVVDCQGSAWDFYNGKDFRILMCANVTQEYFLVIHHELGHIQYFKNYKDLPITFRGGANPGVHEAIGDLMALSASTPKHMAKIGLSQNIDQISEESTLNYLMQVALQKVAFLPFGFLIDSYRWKIFDGTIPRSNLNYEWVKMGNEYQGIVPPVVRTEDDFDPGSKYHVASDTPYISYFVSYILEFQLYRALCETAGEYPAHPLHECDFYQNKAAGQQLKKLLAAGYSQPWQVTLNETIGADRLDASAIQEYFAPLEKFLKAYREEMKYPIGWSTDAFQQFVKPSS